MLLLLPLPPLPLLLSGFKFRLELIIIAEIFFTELDAVTAEGGGGGACEVVRAGPLFSKFGAFGGGGGGFTFGGLGEGRFCVILEREFVCELDRCNIDRFPPPDGG